MNGARFQALVNGELLARLAYPERREIGPQIMRDAVRAAELAGRFEPHIVMEFLPAKELSFDALCWNGRLLRYAARTKIDDEVQTLVTRHELAPEVAGPAKRFRLHGLVNVPFRRRADGRPAILEINPRPAGGSVFSERAGCALIADWLRLLVGELQAHDVTSTALSLTLRREGGMRACAVPAARPPSDR